MPDPWLRSAALQLNRHGGAAFIWETQGELLNEVSDLINAGKLRTTHGETLTPINAANLRAVHAKITLAGWQ